MFYDVFAGLCEKRGIKPSKAAEECGINKSNVSSWKNNGYTPRGDALNKIATYFGVSTDYLMGKEQKEKPSAEAKSLSDIENEILKIYRTLPEDKKQAFMTVARSLKSQSADK